MSPTSLILEQAPATPSSAVPVHPSRLVASFPLTHSPSRHSPPHMASYGRQSLPSQRLPLRFRHIDVAARRKERDMISVTSLAAIGNRWNLLCSPSRNMQSKQRPDASRSIVLVATSAKSARVPGNIHASRVADKGALAHNDRRHALGRRLYAVKTALLERVAISRASYRIYSHLASIGGSSIVSHVWCIQIDAFSKIPPYRTAPRHRLSPGG
jgi:hypothetical protein